MTENKSPGVLFDVDGTLLDTNYLHVLAWWRAFREAGHDHVTMADIHRAIGIGSEELVDRLLGTDGQPDQDTVDKHGERFADLRDHVVRLPGADRLVAECARRGLATVVATSGKESDLDWMLEAIGAGDAVSGATTSDDVDRSKPAPDLLAVAMERQRLDPAATVLVGDTVWDVEAADKAGVRCVALTCGGIGEPDLRRAGAVEVYDDPADLLAHLDDSIIATLVRSDASRDV
jgi:phosphoglycolate phosphatase-like HAD superfamily hydrolase